MAYIVCSKIGELRYEFVKRIGDGSWLLCFHVFLKAGRGVYDCGDISVATARSVGSKN